MIYDERFFDDMRHAIDCREEAMIAETLSWLSDTFVSVIEETVESEKDFVALIGLLHKIVASDEFLDDAKRLRSFLQDKIEKHARQKASDEINKLFWSKRK